MLAPLVGEHPRGSLPETRTTPYSQSHHSRETAPHASKTSRPIDASSIGDPVSPARARGGRDRAGAVACRGRGRLRKLKLELERVGDSACAFRQDEVPAARRPGVRAFHRYIYKPFKSGGVHSYLQPQAGDRQGRRGGLFAYHEIKIALVDAQSSPTLSKLVSPLTALGSKMSSLGSGLKSGKA